MKTIVVTGGAGFIGSNLVHHLCANSRYRVVVVDTLGEGPKWHNLVGAPVEEIVAPANLFYWLEMYGETVEAILHMGGISNTTEKNVDAIMEANHSYAVLLWRWCALNQVRFIYASSAEVYGNGSQGFHDRLDSEAIRQLRPLNANGWSKKVFDQFVAAAVERKEQLPPQWAGLRFFNVYGPNEYHKAEQRSVVCKLYDEAVQGVPVKLYKSGRADVADGAQARDFIYVKDCVNIVAWLLQNPQVNGLFNCGTGQARSFAQLAQALFSALKKPTQIKYVDMPSHVEHRYQYHTQAEMRQLQEAGYNQPFHTLEEGVADYVQHYLPKGHLYL